MKMWDKMGNDSHLMSFLPFNALEYWKCFSSLNLVVLFTKWNDDENKSAWDLFMRRLSYRQTIWWRNGDIVKIISFDLTNNELRASMVQRSKVPNIYVICILYTLKYYYMYMYIRTKIRHFVHSSLIENVFENARGIDVTLILCIASNINTLRIVTSQWAAFGIDGTLNIRPKIWSMIIVLPETILIEWNEWKKEERRQQHLRTHTHTRTMQTYVFMNLLSSEQSTGNFNVIRNGIKNGG